MITYCECKNKCRCITKDTTKFINNKDIIDGARALDTIDMENADLI